MRRLLKHLASTSLVILALGCSDGRVQVKGTVNYNGEPVQEGIIALEPEDRKGQTRAVPIQDGTFVFAGKETVDPGSKIVRIRAAKKTGKKVAAFPGGAETAEESVQYIPAEYNDKSKLTAKIEAGKPNELKFDLKATP